MFYPFSVLFPGLRCQAGSILVIWDYTRLGEDSRRFILLPEPWGRVSKFQADFSYINCP